MARSPSPIPALAGRKVLVGIAGGIAAYKSPSLVRRLREAGAEVRVVMTAGARRFITPMTLQAVSAHPVRSDLWDEQAEAAMGHIELARWADEILVAPASADLISRLAHGMAGDLLTTLVLASEARLWLAPAMNRVMWAHPAVRENCRRLQANGARLLGPGAGDQACGEVGEGRMLEPEALVAALADQPLPGEPVPGGPLPGEPRPLTGHHFVITAGPTYEDLDPVRYLGNRSSGRMGFAVAAAAAGAGARVTLVAGPVCLPTPAGVERVDVRSADDMARAVDVAVPGADVFVGVAAVADYRPASRQASKIKKSGESLTLALVRNPDILAGVAARADRPRLVVGFAAETDDLENNARVKLRAKGVDLIAANSVAAERGFDCADNALEVFSADRHWPLSCQPKDALARALLEIIVEQLDARGGPSG